MFLLVRAVRVRLGGALAGRASSSARCRGPTSRLTDRGIVLLRCCILLLYQARELWAQDFEFISLTCGGAKGIRTPDLLHAISRQHVHRSTSVQVAVPERAHQSGQVRTGCCTFPLYRSAWPVKLPNERLTSQKPPQNSTAMPPGNQASRLRGMCPSRSRWQPRPATITALPQPPTPRSELVFTSRLPASPEVCVIPVPAERPDLAEMSASDVIFMAGSSG